MPIASKPPIFDRPETIFGVCEALGDDFGISAHWFRAALFVLVIVWPVATLAAYLGLAVVILATRLAFPDVRAPVVEVPAMVEPVAAAEPVEEEMRLAA